MSNLESESLRIHLKYLCLMPHRRKPVPVEGMRSKSLAEHTRLKGTLSAVHCEDAQ